MTHEDKECTPRHAYPAATTRSTPTAHILESGITLYRNVPLRGSCLFSSKLK